ncbi:Synaptobrevin YKT6-like protein [Lachnellula hyalina]|uniref:Synaptobrevin homolog YKT6 n=1 Tax=Lachnellula hyalina TaxID=1316788 RepID=A0A8H8TVJ6_9HELO|nr:Synaptobrevin YKT6-like protein [Lachnellula hyalina]TVY23904.1 Synaptobrevin YKT6-like protein [Lachnellula hyalina]
MKIHYIGILKNETKPAHELCAEKDLSAYSRFTRNKYAWATPTSLLQYNGRYYTFHAYGRTEGICGVIITDHAYPALVAHQLLSKVVDEFLAAHPRSSFSSPSINTDSNPALSFPELKDYIVKYQDPQQADSIMKIQKELDETKIVLHKTIESVLQRGEKIDDLVAKSDGLSAQSKMFYTQAKKQNSCCVVM